MPLKCQQNSALTPSFRLLKSLTARVGALNNVADALLTEAFKAVIAFENFEM